MKKAKAEAKVEKVEEERKPPAPLPPHPALPRGPEGMRALSLADGEPEPAEERDENQFSILNHVMGRLWKKSPFAEPILAIEVLDGPYKGIVYAYASFTFVPGMTEDGMVPTKYETEVLSIPPSMKATFESDEAFDLFTSEVLISWIGYIHTHDFTPLIKVRAKVV